MILNKTHNHLITNVLYNDGELTLSCCVGCMKCPHSSDHAALCCVYKLHVLPFQERLEKEKKLSKDLGQAATKLQQLLKATQEQLTKERDTVRTLQEHLEGKVSHALWQHTRL